MVGVTLTPSRNEQVEAHEEQAKGNEKDTGKGKEVLKMSNELKVWITLHAWLFGSLHDIPTFMRPQILLLIPEM